MATNTNMAPPPSIAERDTSLVPDPPRHVEDRAKAVTATKRRVTGIVVLVERSDLDRDINAEPRPVRVIGRVTDEMTETLAA